MADHYHYEYADERHSHSGYADERHDHDYYYAEKYHRHYDLEGLIEGLRADLNAAHERIAELEQASRLAASTPAIVAGEVPDRVFACSGTAECRAPDGNENHAHYCPRYEMKEDT